MKVALFSTHKFEQSYLEAANEGRFDLHFFEEKLSIKTAILAKGYEAISLFVSDDASAPVLELLRAGGCQFIALRSAGFNHVDIEKAKQLGIAVARVPEYSPYAIAEHTLALILALNRKLIRANNRVKELNFSLDGLIGFDLNGKTVGVIGTGKIGEVLVKILHGFGCRILAYDLQENPALVQQYQVQYTDLPILFKASDIISLHVPLTHATRYIINKDSIATMKKGAMLINTSRGDLVATKAVIDALKSGQLAYFGMDVYEEEEGLFFEDLSDTILQDDVIARLMTFPNVLITSHQAFLTDTALKNIATTTIKNLAAFHQQIPLEETSVNK